MKAILGGYEIDIILSELEYRLKNGSTKEQEIINDWIDSKETDSTHKNDDTHIPYQYERALADRYVEEICEVREIDKWDAGFRGVLKDYIRDSFIDGYNAGRGK